MALSCSLAAVRAAAPLASSAARFSGLPEALRRAAISVVTGVTLMVWLPGSALTLTSFSVSPLAALRAATITKGALAVAAMVTVYLPSAPSVPLVPTTAPLASMTVTTPPSKAAPVAAVPENV